jgi:hypothetical protein
MKAVLGDFRLSVKRLHNDRSDVLEPALVQGTGAEGAGSKFSNVPRWAPQVYRYLTLQLRLQRRRRADPPYYI